MPRIFITGSTDGLGRAAAGALIGEGHDVVLHARSRERAAALSDLAADAAGVVIGDLTSAAETRELAGQVNQIGRMDAVIHNAAVFLEPSRSATADGHAKTLAVNTLAPYMLTALIGRPDRLIYLSSGLHQPAAGVQDPAGHPRTPAGPGRRPRLPETAAPHRARATLARVCRYSATSSISVAGSTWLRRRSPVTGAASWAAHQTWLAKCSNDRRDRSVRGGCG